MQIKDEWARQTSSLLWQWVLMNDRNTGTACSMLLLFQPLRKIASWKKAVYSLSPHWYGKLQSDNLKQNSVKLITCGKRLTILQNWVWSDIKVTCAEYMKNTSNIPRVALRSWSSAGEKCILYIFIWHFHILLTIKITSYKSFGIACDVTTSMETSRTVIPAISRHTSNKLL